MSDDEGPSTSRNDPKQLKTTDVASIFDLKNELLKRKNKVSAQGANTISKGNDYGFHVKQGGVLAVKKDEKIKMKSESSERKRKIAEYEAALRIEENERLAIASKKMKEKSELYDKLKEGNIQLSHKDDTPVEFMVDFQMKKRQYEDERDRRNKSPSPIVEEKEASVVEHFKPDEEGRIYGVSHMKLSTDEEKRKEQIQELYDLSDQTDKERARRAEILRKRDEMKKKRTADMRKRLGLPEEKSPEPEPEPEYLDIPMPAIETIEQRFERNIKNTREWDRGKGSYINWIQKQRDAREDEFRPPDAYFK